MEVCAKPAGRIPLTLGGFSEGWGGPGRRPHCRYGAVVGGAQTEMRRSKVVMQCAGTWNLLVFLESRDILVP